MIAVLAELSGKRTRRPSDESVSSSSRIADLKLTKVTLRWEREARGHEGTPLPLWDLPSPWRCLPSSPTGWLARPPHTLCPGSSKNQNLGSLKFQNQRETDLSLGSLLSRNQSLFGHSHHPPHPSLPLSSMSHLSQVGMRLKISLSRPSQTLSQSVITAHAQSQTSRQPRQSGSGNSRSPGGGPDRYRPT